jgi:regulation of enolase protein 1 (concanavalin A-like superfamily)
VADVGSPQATGSGTLTTGTFAVASRGYEVNGTSDQFTFVYRSVKGDVSIVAKLSSLQNTNPWSQAGLMIRDSLDANSNHSFVFGTPGNGVVFRSRVSARGGTSQTLGGGSVAPVWLRIDRKSSMVTASRSLDGISWTTVATQKVRSNQSILVGFAVASRSATSGVAASIERVSLNGTPVPNSAPAPPVNVPPSVSLTSPANGASYGAPAAIAMSASASDSDGSVAKVDFYNGTTLLGTDSSSPYSFSWNNVGAGSYSLKAVATDNAGAATNSGSVTVTVSANTPPAVSLTSPSGGTSFMAPASTTVAAVATDANGSVARVDFYAGSTLLGSDTTSPYSVNWSNVPAGSYLLTARATDNTGASTMSAGVNVTVNANQAPTVSLTSPATGTIFSTPATVTMTASANDADGSIQKVEFYNGSTLLGSDTTSPFTFSWSNVPAGAYSLSAVAHDNLGASTVSSWSDITVGAATVLSTAIFAPAVVPDAIDFYVFEVFAAGSDPLVAAPVASQNLGVPTPINGEIVANVGSTISALAPGSYIATVSSFSAGEGVLRSSPFAFTR